MSPERIKYLWATCTSINFHGLVPVNLPEWYTHEIGQGREHFDVFFDQPKQRRWAAPDDEIEDAEWWER